MLREWQYPTGGLDFHARLQINTASSCLNDTAMQYVLRRVNEGRDLNLRTLIGMEPTPALWQFIDDAGRGCPDVRAALDRAAVAASAKWFDPAGSVYYTGEAS